MTLELELGVGERYGMWTVIGERVAGGLVPVRCDCGHEQLVRIHDLRRRHSRSCRSCGHLASNAANTKHGESKARLYKTWSGMKSRCQTPSATGYDRYGGRGIEVCPAWSRYYTVFREWARSAGYQEGLTIDRIDPDGNYEPDNCRWLPAAENSRRARRGAARGKRDAARKK